MEGPGIPDWFIGLFVLFFAAAILTGIYRISMARSMARRAGMDPNEATAATLLSQDGLSATYLAANLRGQAQPLTAAPRGRTTESRLQELKSLLDQGLVTQTEYDERRSAILAEI